MSEHRLGLVVIAVLLVVCCGIGWMIADTMWGSRPGAQPVKQSPEEIATLPVNSPVFRTGGTAHPMTIGFAIVADGKCHSISLDPTTSMSVAGIGPEAPMSLCRSRPEPFSPFTSN